MINQKITNEAANIQLDALSPLANSGYLRLYDGSQPNTADSPITTQRVLASLRFNAVAFGASSDGVMVANGMTDDPDAIASGVATWFRVYKSDGITPLWDGSVGTSDADMTLETTEIRQHARVSINSYVFILPK